ncbi:YetF domain-containing protein [Dethiobacter alkaliphilus]|uniref:YetF C-terminal domain-containing protein n=1 Tax=Dethiobacter alkaliphilus AHT 1 TaxID=555088 RepID=C0GJP2_DETAL|nr:DUF421 domain-containing protein [Dethiobacter alkaliphilus]EEG76464.1 protein of unknown function DUF421 [Dethiobacter alkaliphilus AHT 1]MCW3491195.1 DUF421 domain-containing protein [Dethiobacter alkaliphilus]
MEWALFTRSAILYLAVLLAIRIMGKREVGQLSAFDLVVAIMIAELAAMSMEQIDMPLHEGLIPIFTLVALEILFAFLSMKSHTIRGIVDGGPSIVIANGKIIEKEMRKLRYNMSDLLTQLRVKDVPNIADVQYAVLETSGELSVILRPEKRPVTPQDLGLPTKYEGMPTPLVFDGHIHFNNLRGLHLDEQWLLKEVQKKGVDRIEDVLFASLDTDGNLYISEKESSRKPAD